MKMEKYESKQQRILRPAQMIYDAVCDFRNFTPMLQNRVEGWNATGEQLLFQGQGLQRKSQHSGQGSAQICQNQG